MRLIFGPATALMTRLKFPQRFALITFLFLLPLGYALWAFISTVNYQINLSRKETWGDAYLRPLHTLYRDMTEDWLLSQSALRGLTTNNDALQQNQVKIDRDFDALASVDSLYGSQFGTSPALSALKSDWADVTSLPQNTSRQSKYATTIAGILNLISTVGDRSNLVLDPDLDTYYTKDALLIQLPALQNTIADLAVRVDPILADATLTANQRTELTLLQGQILKYNDNLTKGADVAFANNPMGNLESAVDGPRNQARIALNDFLTILDTKIFQAPTITLSSTSWMEQARNALQASYNQWDVQVAQMDLLLNNRIAGFESNRTIALVITLIALFIVTYMWVGFSRAVMHSVSSLEQTANMLASGNLDSAVSMSARDEISQTAAAAINKMANVTTQLNSAMLQRTSELTELSYLLAYMHDGVVITDDRGMIKVLNGTATRILNTHYDTAISQPILAYVQDARLQETMRAAWVAPGQRFAVDVAINSRLISFVITFVPVEDTKTGLFVMQDVTELRTLQQQQQFAWVSTTR